MQELIQLIQLLGPAIAPAFLVSITIQLLVKTKLLTAFQEEAWYDLALNGSAVLLALAWCWVFQMVGWVPEGVFVLAITTAISAALAVFGYEVVKNIWLGVGGKE